MWAWERVGTVVVSIAWLGEKGVTWLTNVVCGLGEEVEGFFWVGVLMGHGVRRESQRPSKGRGIM